MGAASCAACRDEPEAKLVESIVRNQFPDDDVRLTVAIAGADGLREMSSPAGCPSSASAAKLRERSGCRCTVEAPSRRDSMFRFRTSVANDVLASASVWRAEVPIADYVAGAPLTFTVIDEGGTGDVMGSTVLEASSFADCGFNGELPLTGGKSRNAILKVKVRNAFQDYPPGPPPQFTVTVKKEALDAPLGLKLDLQDRALAYVVGVREGPFRTYNESADAGCQLHPGDFIERVNDSKGDVTAMVKAFRSASELEVGVRRPEEYSAMLRRSHPGEPIGLLFPKRLSGVTLPIVKISDGACLEWNNQHPELKVRVGDRIIMVDGNRGQAADLVEKLATSQQVLLTIARPAVIDGERSWRFW